MDIGFRGFFSTRWAALTLAAGCLAAAGHASAQQANDPARGYPNRPIRLIVPVPPGGSVDAMARLLARQLEPQLGQTIVVDNRGGANGIIGFEMVARAPADGYTLLSTAAAFAIDPAMYRELPYDTDKDFAPITNFANGPGYVMVAHPSVPAQTLKELIALAKDKPMRYSSAGIGNGQHLVGELFNLKAGVKILHVPYKGGGPAFNAIVGGEVNVHFAAVITALAHVKSNRLRPLGFTGAQRVAVLPEVPTFTESAFPGFIYQTGWHAWFAPARTPSAIINKLQAEIARAVQEPKLREHFVAAGSEPVSVPPAEFQKIFHADIQRYIDIVRAAKIDPQ